MNGWRHLVKGQPQPPVQHDFEPARSYSPRPRDAGERRKYAQAIELGETADLPGQGRGPDRRRRPGHPAGLRRAQGQLPHQPDQEQDPLSDLRRDDCRRVAAIWGRLPVVHHDQPDEPPADAGHLQGRQLLRPGPPGTSSSSSRGRCRTSASTAGSCWRTRTRSPARPTVTAGASGPWPAAGPWPT